MPHDNQPKLDPDERRALTLEALAGADKKALAQRYGVSRARVYQLLDEALDNPKGKRDEAEKELKFRRRVLRARHH